MLGAGSCFLVFGVEAFGSGLGSWVLGAWSGFVVPGPCAWGVLEFLGFLVGLEVLGRRFWAMGLGGSRGVCLTLIGHFLPRWKSCMAPDLVPNTI